MAYTIFAFSEGFVKHILYVVSAALVLSIAAPVYGQSGCVNSPENPTAILALVGSAGVFVAAVRGRFRG